MSLLVLNGQTLSVHHKLSIDHLPDNKAIEGPGPLVWFKRCYFTSSMTKCVEPREAMWACPI